MKLIQLEHDKRLGMPKPKDLLYISESYIQQAERDGCDSFLSFRNYPINKETTHIRNVNACTRITGISGKIAVFALEDDSFLFPLILWDLSHSMAIGESIHFYGDSIERNGLNKAYYASAFQEKRHNETHLEYIKSAPLPAEENRGLEDWTFGIPVGPGDAFILNAVVKRILEIPCRNKEIILCGRPGDNFRYWNEVKIVGEDIPAPPVRICKKKNTIVENARYGNLCILHDRVFLPSDFMEAMRKFGDDYPVLTMQSLYFDDYGNRDYYRYSDYGVVADTAISHGVMAMRPTAQGYENSLICKETVGIFNRNNRFSCQNSLRYSSKTYATGSLYIAKKSVWLNAPLDETLNWEEFEDVEWGIRCAENGIPHRVNPFSLAQSILARSAVLCVEGLWIIKPNGKTSVFRRHASLENRKPLIKCTEDEAWRNFMAFRDKYCPSLTLKVRALTARYRTYVVTQLLCAASFELTVDTIETFFRDVESKLLYATLYPELKLHIREHLFRASKEAMPDFIFSYELKKQLALRWRGSLFMNTPGEFGVPPTFRLKIGTILSALSLARHNGVLFYHPDGLRGYYCAIRNSTPYISYFTEDDHEEICNQRK